MTDGGDQATLAENRRIGRRVLLEIWSAGKLEVVDELYAPDYVDHVARGPEPGVVRGPDGLKQAVTMFRSAFPDLSYTIEQEMAEGDCVMTRFSATGTHRGPFLSMEPSGRSVTYTGVDINRIVDGRVVESWVYYDALGLLEQVGLVPRIEGA
jgi:predicted ester cyclase